jgi:hypothetical protein
MSNVAIGEALGVSDETVRRDMAGSTNVDPDRKALGKDGKTYAKPKRKPKPGPVEPEPVIDAEVVDPPDDDGPSVTGIKSLLAEST